LGTVPIAPTFTAGQKLTAANLNKMGSVLSYLSTPPQCSAYQSATQSPANAAWTVVTLDAELFDVANNYDGGSDSPMHDNVTNNSRIYVRTTGKYELSGQVAFSSNATNARQASIRVNSNSDTTLATGYEAIGGKQSAVSGIATSVPMPPVVIPLSAGDYIELFAWQNSGGALALITGQSQTYMRLKWVAP
jgi:hypothetical protein